MPGRSHGDETYSHTLEADIGRILSGDLHGNKFLGRSPLTLPEDVHGQTLLPPEGVSLAGCPFLHGTVYPWLYGPSSMVDVFLAGCSFVRWRCILCRMPLHPGEGLFFAGCLCGGSGHPIPEIVLFLSYEL